MYDESGKWQEAIQLINQNKTTEADELLQYLLSLYKYSDCVQFAAGYLYLKLGDDAKSITYFRNSLALNSANLLAGWFLAILVGRPGTHKASAQSRDILLELINNNGPLIEIHEYGVMILRRAAELCDAVGPKQEAVTLQRVVAERTQNADEYIKLSEYCASVKLPDEAETALRKAISIDPNQYDTDSNRHTLKMLEGARSTVGRRRAVKINNYPLTEEFSGDLEHLIYNHIASEHQNLPKLITRDTKFFTMGSCFAREVARSLNLSGFTAIHMEISEHLNTSFANKCFVDWLEGSLEDDALSTRIETLMPKDFSRQSLIGNIQNAGVIVLTLGSAAAFFDRTTGQFILPQAKMLNMHALAETYQSRTTSVAENVENLVYVLSFFRKLSPNATIILTVSPVPLPMTFEFDSAVVADCLSKSTLRVTAQEVVYNRGIKNIYYWPAFEIFRWAGSQNGQFYGSDDGAAWHVSEAIVDRMIDCYLKMFGGTHPN